MEADEKNGAKGITSTLVLFGGLLLLYAVGVAEVVSWLRFGHWPGWTLASLCLPLLGASTFSHWLAEPHSWYGLQWVVKTLINQSILLWIFVAVFAAWYRLDQKAD